MEPIVLIHGYSSESKRNDPASIEAIYGTLRADLQRRFSTPQIVAVNVSRYISLDDGVDLDDLSLAFDRALKTDFPQLLTSGFNAVIHSTGALVIRNWVRRHSAKPSPLKRIVHLAGANLGSGWAHIGETQLVKWLRFIGHEGEARGLAVLSGLELGSDWAIDLHRYFLEPGQDMLNDYGVMEFNVIGSQVPPAWMVVPFRYGKEDGSDGVVRVSASNLNFHYMRIGPTAGANTNWQDAAGFARRAVNAAAANRVTAIADVFGGGYYEVKADCRPADARMVSPLTRSRTLVPLAIPYQCAHSTDDMGIVYGTNTRPEVMQLLDDALNCQRAGYPAQVANFQGVTDSTYTQVAQPGHASGLLGRIRDRLVRSVFTNPEGQYDKHAQVIVRVRDQHGKPVQDFSIHFNSKGGDGRATTLIDTFFEDKHKNNLAPNLAFYLRTDRFNPSTRQFEPRLPELQGVDLEIDVLDSSTNRVLFVPLRMRIKDAELVDWIQPHRTTIIDVELLRLPHSDTFILQR